MSVEPVDRTSLTEIRNLAATLLFECFCGLLIGGAVISVSVICIALLLSTLVHLGWVHLLGSAFIIAASGLGFCFYGYAAMFTAGKPTPKLCAMVAALGFLFSSLFPVTYFIYGCTQGASFFGWTGLTLIGAAFFSSIFLEIVHTLTKPSQTESHKSDVSDQRND